MLWRACRKNRIWCLAVTALLLLFLRINGQASDSRQVRVAFFPMEGFHTITWSGEYSGMDVEYLDAVNEFADWDIEYVECGSWDDALEMLKTGEVDLVGSAQYSPERAQSYLYADFPSGYTFGAIMVNGDSQLAYGDFEALADADFGIVKTYVRRTEFLQYLEEQGITEPHIKEYESTEKLQQALAAGEVDAIVHSFMEMQEGQRIVGKFAPRPFYYISGLENEELIKELNCALADLRMENPTLESDLMNKYYTSRLNQTKTLSLAEKEYAADAGTLRIGYLDGYYPFSYESDNVYSGISREVLELMSEETGISLTYQKMYDLDEALEALENGEIDILGYCDKNNSRLYEKEKFISVTYATTNLTKYIVGKEGETELSERLDILPEEANIVLVIRADEEEALKGILGKTISSVDDKRISEYILQNPEPSTFELDDWIRENSTEIAVVVIVVILLVLGVALKMLHDSRKMQQLLYTDPESGIWNMNYFTYKGGLLAEQKIRYAVIYINIIRFRTYCTLYGWQAGNHLVNVMVQVLSENVDSRTELFARNEGDRFLLMLQADSGKLLEHRLSRLVAELEQRFLEESGSHLEVHMGIYYLPESSRDIKTAISRANQALDFPGNDANGAIRVYDEKLGEQIREQHRKEELLERAEIWKDFTVYYQAKVDIRGNKVVGAEALVRFLDPSAQGQVRSPGFFIPYYEKTGKIKEIDFFVFETVCRMLRKRIDQGLAVVPISCNFSRRHFVENGFTDRLEEVLEKYHISRDLIEVEITETIIIEEVQQSRLRSTLEELKEKGIRLSIDDFGSGYSSLGIFEQVPASAIKLDRSFLLNHIDHGRQVKIMREIVTLADMLDTQVICEGVENDEDVKLMNEIGAYVAQGFFYARPVPEKEFEARLDS